MDIDDNIFEVDEMNPAYIRFNPQSEPLKIATKILQDVDVVTTSTPHLANTIKSYRTKPTLVMPNLINPDTYRYKASLVPQNREKIVIGYQGSSTHYSDLMLTGVMHALRQIAIKYPQVHFHFTGCIIDELEDYIPKDRLTMQGGARDHRKWVDLWKELPYDIGIAPLTNTSFNMSKSPIKYYEYGLRKIPAVYSFVEPYVRTVKENKTGFLAIDEQEWFEKLSWLVENEILRKRMGDRARKDVLENYTIQKGYKKWEELIKAL